MTDVKVEQCDKQASFALLVGKKVGGGDGDTYVTRFPSLQEVEAAFARHRQAAEKATREAIIALAHGEYVDAEATGDEMDAAYNRAINDVIYATRIQGHE